MPKISHILLLISLLLASVLAHAGTCGSCSKSGKHCRGRCDNCCANMGGISYCDSSVGRLVCRNGSFSTCYCTRHAVMDLDHIQGCCLWQNGVRAIRNSLVICNNGDISRVCSFQPPPLNVADW